MYDNGYASRTLVHPFFCSVAGPLPRNLGGWVYVRLERVARQPYQLPSERCHQGLDGGAPAHEGNNNNDNNNDNNNNNNDNDNNNNNNNNVGR